MPCTYLQTHDTSAHFNTTLDTNDTSSSTISENEVSVAVDVVFRTSISSSERSALLIRSIGESCFDVILCVELYDLVVFLLLRYVLVILFSKIFIEIFLEIFVGYFGIF